jgi:hypothetical protein
MPNLRGWSWEAGLDLTSPEAENGSQEVHLMLLRADLGTNLYEWVGPETEVYLHWGGQSSLRVSPGSGADFMLTAGIGLRSRRNHWDFRFTGQGVLGRANIDQYWVVTGGYVF